jgi:hypothetical protein
MAFFIGERRGVSPPVLLSDRWADAAPFAEFVRVAPDSE